MFERVKAFYRGHEPACTAGFFAAGFLFDTLAVGRIDKWLNILHQAVYLSLCAYFTGLELRETHGRFTPPERLKTAWRYHTGATHFMLGTLLNIYTLFYFKSASMGTSLLFLLVLAALLALNELKPFERSGTLLRMSLFSLCLVSYFTYLVPTLMGRIGAVPFLGSIAAASACIAGFTWRLYGRMPEQKQAVRGHVVYPFAAIAALFAALYFAKVIPPVPLSLTEIGIYHDVRRAGDRFELSSTRPRWKFWQRGDQTFLARPGDPIYCWVRVFSPTRFQDRLAVRWRFLEPEGWGESEVIPLPITGGRDGGWRGFTFKANYKPGRWRVEVVTSDGRELGHIGLAVEPDDSTAPRVPRILWR
ncbi:MAG TPA: hypothetical protein DCM05_05455 [Elusimicrobia bacterium]|nr:hypothetical protein [Elusimicrobiota bacterium]